MAEVSGPGQFSQRTDKAVSNANATLPNAQYGENSDYQDQKSGAAMAKQPGGNVDLSSVLGDAAANVIPINSPTQQPGVPVTDGAATGAGRGVDALGLPDQKIQDLQSLQPYLPVLEFMANQPGASWAMRNVVRQVKSNG